jgi:hypothetical protein
VYGNVLNEQQIRNWNERLIDFNLIDTKVILEQSQDSDLQQKVKE